MIRKTSMVILNMMPSRYFLVKYKLQTQIKLEDEDLEENDLEEPTLENNTTKKANLTDPGTSDPTRDKGKGFMKEPAKKTALNSPRFNKNSERMKEIFPEDSMSIADLQESLNAKRDQSKGKKENPCRGDLRNSINHEIWYREYPDEHTRRLDYQITALTKLIEC
uniref:Uncharacterized protein n=1 Tax=Cannabis sativa TaxID=3483 RepID=A0A803NT73_CANSA